MSRRPLLPPRAGAGKLGDITGITNRTQATPQPVEDRTGAGFTRALIYTYFTKPPVVGEQTPILYNGDNNWARVTLNMETAGPVAVGNLAELDPVLSGKGILLQTNTPLVFTIAKGSKLYILSTGVNRIKVQIDPVPWLEQITGTLRAMVGSKL